MKTNLVNEEKNSSGVAAESPRPAQAESVLDDIWGEEGMFHLRILSKFVRGTSQRVIEICNCGMSGKCKPLGRITIADFRRKRVIAAFDFMEEPNDSRP